MKITKAVITAAGRGSRLYPATDTVQKAMLPITDRDGLAKPAIQIIAEEAIQCGIEEICVVCVDGDEQRYLTQFGFLRENLLNAYRGAEWAEEQAQRIGDLLDRIHFAVQQEPLGYGHAVHCAREFIGPDAFLLMLGDHLYVPQPGGARCATQVIDLVEQAECSVSTVQATREHLIGNYGTLTGNHVSGLPGVYEIQRIIEKPSLGLAELELQTPGLRAGFYLCLVGMHALTPGIFDCLEEQMEHQGDGVDVQLTPALQELARREKCLALAVKGRWYDISQKFGLLRTQIALGLAGVDQTEVLSAMAESLVEAQRDSGIERKDNRESVR